MPWYGWLILALAAVIVLASITLRVLRATRKGRRFLALSTRAKIGFGRSLMSDPDVPVLDKVALAVLVGYLALPFDLIPDFIPVIGQLDDFLVVSVVLLLLVKTIPNDVFEAAIAHAEEAQNERNARGRVTDQSTKPTHLPPST